MAPVPDEEDNEAAEEQEAQAESPPRRERLKRAVEALLFASDSVLKSGKLAELAGAEDGHEARELVVELKEEYDEAGRAFCIEEVAGGYRMVTRPRYHRWLKELKRSEKKQSLSQAAMETLAIVAYRQPLNRAEIEDIRGVQSGYILRSLVEKNLVRVVGRSTELGRPLLYGTTSTFLEEFGLDSLDDLPEIGELSD
ncbi:MAG: SMC-Scp complex subunit ScpB [Planctomycetota bacterium]